MNAVDGSEHYEKASHQQNPSLLAVILDTNPAAWTLLADTLPLSSAVANLLVFINAHLACNYTNKVAVIASHCDKARWLYPSPQDQEPPAAKRQKRHVGSDSLASASDQLAEPTKRLKLNGPKQDGTSATTNIKSPQKDADASGNKYRPFRLVEEEVLSNLTTLLASTSPSALEDSTSTMIAGALTLALSYINRESIAYIESQVGTSKSTGTTNSITPSSTDAGAQGSSSTTLRSKILLLSASPSTDLAHQYIPIMNAIFACQRLAIPIDILQLPLPSAESNSTVFLQQAADATHGIFIPAKIHPPPSSASQALLTYLLTAFLPSPSTRTHLVLPTRIDVDFRAACFCHRDIVDLGFVCSICLSIFCSVPPNAECLTCGNHLALGEYGRKPVVVGGKDAGRKGGKKKISGGVGSNGQASRRERDRNILGVDDDGGRPVD